MNTIWFKGTESPFYKDALKIRYDVFIKEQHVPEELEIDELETAAEHMVMYENEQPVGTGRIYECEKGVYQIQRVAIDKRYRGQGIGFLLMKEVENHIGKKQANAEMVLDAQIHALPFYEKLGFVSEGPVFMDAGISHKKMTKNASYSS